MDSRISLMDLSASEESTYVYIYVDVKWCVHIHYDDDTPPRQYIYSREDTERIFSSA